MDIEEQVSFLYERMRKKYYSDNDKIFDRWKYKNVWRIRCEDTKDEIRYFLYKGYQVKTGYMTTSIRGYHTYIILYKECK